MGNVIVDVGTLAGRPAPRTSTEGKFYLADDTDELFVQNDMAWVLAATVGGGGGGAAALDIVTIVASDQPNIPDLSGTILLKDEVVWVVQDDFGTQAQYDLVNGIVKTGDAGLYRLTWQAKLYGLMPNDQMSVGNANLSAWTPVPNAFTQAGWDGRVAAASNTDQANWTGGLSQVFNFPAAYEIDIRLNANVQSGAAFEGNVFPYDTFMQLEYLGPTP